MGVMDENDIRRESEAAARRRQDFEDLNLEMAGVSVGRVRRFLPEGAHPDSLQKRREKERSEQTALMILMTDPEYAALYNDTMDKLREAELATEAALAEAVEALDRAKADHKDGLDGASTLPDGTKVFRDADGNVFTEDGELVEGHDLDDIQWRDGAISHEEFLARKKALEEAEQAHTALLRYQTNVLGAARDRLSDQHDPPDMDELRDIQQQIDAHMPTQVQPLIQPVPQQESGPVLGPQTLVPDIG